MVIGCAGSGKSTISKQLAERYALPVVHLDHHFWRPGWNRLSDAEWEAEIERLAGADRWIHDGNYNTTMPRRLPRADLVVFMDTARWRCLWRVLKRRLARSQDIPGCTETFDPQFLRYVWRFPKHSRGRVLANLAPHTDRIPVVHLRTPREVRDFLSSLDR